MRYKNNKKILFWLISFLLGILSVEFGLQAINAVASLFIKKQENNPLLLYYQDKPMAQQIWKETWEAINDRDYTPFLGWADKTYHGLYVNEDQLLGRKTWNPEVPGGQALAKIFFLGGSSGWGIGARDDFTIPSYLSRMLNVSRSQVQVFNYCVPGYTFMQDVIRLGLMLREGQSPQYVIFYDGFNEIFVAHQQGTAGAVYNLSMTRERLERDKLRYRELIWTGLKEAIRKYCMIYRGINALIPATTQDKERQEIADKYNDDQLHLLSRDIVNDYLKSAVLLEHLSKAYGFKYICFWQPSMFTENKLWDKESNIDPWLKNKALRKLSIYTNEYLQKKKIPHFYNLTDVLKERGEPLYVDAAHVSEKGNEIIANVIYQYVQKEFNLTGGVTYGPMTSQ